MRVLQILDARRSKSVAVWKPAPWVVAGFSVVCLVGTGQAPRLVAFRDSAAPRIDSTAAMEYPVRANEYAPPMVPVSFTVRENHVNTANHKTNTKQPARRIVKNVRKSDGRAAALRAQLTDPSVARTVPTAHRVPQGQAETEQGATLMRTGAHESREIAVMQQAVFVVVQSDPWGQNVPMLWRVSVWRFTIVPQTAPRVTSESSSKSI
jgi:hypothetical protein